MHVGMCRETEYNLTVARPYKTTLIHNLQQITQEASLIHIKCVGSQTLPLETGLRNQTTRVVTVSRNFFFSCFQFRRNIYVSLTSH